MPCTTPLTMRLMCGHTHLQENKRKEAKILEDMKRLVDSTLGPGATEEGPAVVVGPDAFQAGGVEGGGA